MIFYKKLEVLLEKNLEILKKKDRNKHILDLDKQNKKCLEILKTCINLLHYYENNTENRIKHLEDKLDKLDNKENKPIYNNYDYQ